MADLTRWKRGDAFSASHLNESLDLLAALAPLSGGGDTAVISGKNGTSIFTPRGRLAGQISLIFLQKTATGKGLYEGKKLNDTPSQFDITHNGDDLVDKLTTNSDCNDVVVWNPADYKTNNWSLDPTNDDPIPILAFLSTKQTSETIPRPIYYLLFIFVRRPIFVHLTLNHGSNGSVSGGIINNASYFYDLINPDNSTLIFANVAPAGNRPQGPLLGPGTIGMARRNPDGTYTLISTDEQMAVTTCPTSP